MLQRRPTQVQLNSARRTPSTTIATATPQMLMLALPTRFCSSAMLTAIPTHSQLVQTSAPVRPMLVTAQRFRAQLIAMTVTTLSTQLQLNSARQTPSTTTVTETYRISMLALQTRFCSSATLTAIPTHWQLEQTSAPVRPMLVTALRFRAQSIAMTIRPQPTQVQSNSARRTRLTTTATATYRTSMPTLQTRFFTERTSTATVPRSQLVQTSAQERPILDTCSQSRRRSIATTTMQPSLFLSHTLSTATWTASDLQLQRRTVHRGQSLDSHSAVQTATMLTAPSARNRRITLIQTATVSERQVQRCSA